MKPLQLIFLVSCMSPKVVIIKGFFKISLNNDVFRTNLHGRLQHEFQIKQFDFHYMPLTDITTEKCGIQNGGIEKDCNGIISISSCVVKPYCENTLKKHMRGTSYETNSRLGCKENSTIMNMNPFQQWTDFCECHSSIFFTKNNSEADYVNTTSKFQFKNYYESILYQIALLDKYDNSPSVVFLCKNYYHKNLILPDLFDNRVVQSHFWNIQSFNILLHVTNKFQCIDSYTGYACSFRCVPNIRRYCVKIHLKNKTESFEKCKKGWIAIQRDYILKLPFCELNEPNPKFIEKSYYHCLIYDTCIKNPNLCQGANNYCLLPGNATYFCAVILPIYKSDRHKFIDNVTTNLVEVNETFTCEYNKENLPFILQEISYSKWSHVHDINELTNSVEKRIQKNQFLSINGNTLKFKNMGGCDFLVNCELHIASEYLVLNYQANFTILDGKNHPCGSFNNYDEHAFTNHDGILVNIGLNALKKQHRSPRFKSDDEFPENPPLEQDCTVYEWLPLTKQIFVAKDTIGCKCNCRNPCHTHVFQISGPTFFDDDLGMNISLEKFQPGIYNFLCKLIVNKTFVYPLYKYLHIIVDTPTQVCFIPFAPIKGFLIKCTSNTFPMNISKFSMAIYDKEVGNVLTTSDENTIRIPYDIPLKKEFEVTCTWTGNTALPSINSRFLIKSSKVQTPIVAYRDCLKLDYMPDEYQFTFKQRNNLYFYSEIFFFEEQQGAEEGFYFVIILLVFLFLYPVIPITMRVRKRSKHQMHTGIQDQIKFLSRRNILYKLHEQELKKRRKSINYLSAFEQQSSLKTAVTVMKIHKHDSHTTDGLNRHIEFLNTKIADLE